MLKKLILFALLSVNILSAQKVWDSTYYVKYRSRIITSLFYSYKFYNIDLEQFVKKDSLGRSKPSYIAPANNILGLEFNYDKINFSFGYAAPSTEIKKKGKTDHFNIGLNVGGNKWILETAYRRYQGFYDNNTSRYDSAFYKWDSVSPLSDRRGIYTQFPHMVSTSYKMKFLFFTNNKKFSFKSGYSCSYRQLKSSFSWVVTANAYYNTLNSDSSLIPRQIQSYYDLHANIKGMDVVGCSVYGGASFNLVLWRAFFVNVTVLGGPEQQWRTYKYLNDTLKLGRTTSYIAYSGDLRGSMGLNFKRWFVISSIVCDFSINKSNAMRFVQRYISGQFSIGYRFKVKTPKIYQRFQQTKLYQFM